MGSGLIGIVVNDGTLSNETINNNTYSHVEWANYAEQTNGDGSTSGTSGLQYRCNTFNGYSGIIRGSSVRDAVRAVSPANQGASCRTTATPAGNQFNNTCTGQQWLSADPEVTQVVIYNNNYNGSFYDPSPCYNGSLYTDNSCVFSGTRPSILDACPPGYDYTNTSNVVIHGNLTTLDAEITEATDGTLADLQSEHDYDVSFLARYYALNGMYDSAAVLLAGYNMYRDAIPFYLAAGDFTDAQTMQTDMPLNTADDSLYAWIAQLAITLYGEHPEQSWFNLDTTSLDSMKRLEQYNSAAGYMAGGIAALNGVGRVHWPIPILDSALIDSAIAHLDSSGYFTASRHSAPAITNANSSGKQTFSIFPNPTTGSFTLSVSGSGTFTLYTLLGQKLQQYLVAAGQTELQFPVNISAGMYIGTYKPDDGTNQSTAHLVYQPY